MQLTNSYDKKKAIKEYVEQQAKLIAFCHKQVAAELPECEEETIQKYATSLYINIHKTF